MSKTNRDRITNETIRHMWEKQQYLSDKPFCDWAVDLLCEYADRFGDIRLNRDAYFREKIVFSEKPDLNKHLSHRI